MTTFAVADDTNLVDLLGRARHRLVVIAPALTEKVADALVRRFADLDDVTVILDSDPEVYRMGYGDQAALDAIRKGCEQFHIGLREQSGVRIGVVIADDRTMIFAPVSRNIEAGSTSPEKPNAIVLDKPAPPPAPEPDRPSPPPPPAVSDILAAAAGASNDDNAPPPEVGEKALTPERADAMSVDLIRNPPRPFDITRRVNVFSSKVQYVQLKVSNYRFSAREVPLAPELIDVTDEELKDSIKSRIRTPFDSVDRMEIAFEHAGQAETLKVNERWLEDERKRIERAYTYQVNNFGRVIFREHKAGFDKAIARFEAIVGAYQEALRETLKKSRVEFESRIVEEYRSRWQINPPEHLSHWGILNSPDAIEEELKRLAAEMFNEAIDFEEPKVRVIYKNVAPENVADSAFLESLEDVMTRRRVPPAIIKSLFDSGEAAAAVGDLLAR